jgi:hypothetical protein
MRSPKAAEFVILTNGCEWFPDDAAGVGYDAVARERMTYDRIPK